MYDGDTIVLTILYTFFYTIFSIGMAFKMNDIFADDYSIEKLTKHFILWPIEGLFILILSLIVKLEENGIMILKRKRK